MEIRTYKRKNKVIINLVRGGILLVLLLFSCLLGCGIAYIYGLFTKDDSVSVYSNNNIKVSGGQDESENDLLITKEPDNVNEPTKYEPDVVCVVLDAGHGGTDQGTSKGNVLEKDINLEVTLKIKKLLENNGIKVILTRDNDRSIGLEERAALANENNADLFISIHCNYFEGSSDVSGLECYYNPSSTEGKVYAESIISACENSERIHVRNAKPEDFSVLRNTKMPAVLIEIGFMSNYAELINLTDESYQTHLAEKITEGILSELM